MTHQADSTNGPRVGVESGAEPAASQQLPGPLPAEILTRPIAVRVAVLRDWKKCSRGVFWEDLLDKLVLAPNLCQPYCLAENIAEPFFLRHFDVLIVNWDSINGDPDFGSDAALRWFDHRRLEVLMWVRDGGIVIVEGQAEAGVPDEQAYAAISSDLAVCGVENKLDPRAQDTRSGSTCRMTGLARSSPLFGHLDRITAAHQPSFEDMFPNLAASVVTPYLRDVTWGLYRGWFRWRPYRPGELPWVPLVKTDSRGFGRNHPTLLAAKYGKGAIFVSTMFLASSGQSRLVAAMLSAFERTNDLPEPRRALALLQRFVGPALFSVIAAGVTAIVAREVGASWVAQGISLVAVALLFFGIGRAWSSIRRLWRDITGR